ncbi:phage tail assembly protein [Methylobacterium ajmalii]|uniref:Phage tail assembly protein n=1 Tax=Methylobacterium ajmalii TaxID=2738439 RepID=A0ABV0A3X9_9HYPH
MANEVSGATGATSTSRVFELERPFEYRGARYHSLTAREPKVRDLREFLKNVDRDSIAAMEKVLSNLTEVDEKIIAEMSIPDFAVMKKWFEGFLKPMINDSED